MLKHLQLRLPEAEFKEVKKAAIDASMTMDQFLRTAAFKEMGYDVLPDGTVIKKVGKVE
jgi:hypothetical protein